MVADSQSASTMDPSEPLLIKLRLCSLKGVPIAEMIVYTVAHIQFSIFNTTVIYFPSRCLSFPVKVARMTLTSCYRMQFIICSAVQAPMDIAILRPNPTR